LSWPTQYLAVYSNDSSFTLNPSLLAGQFNNNVQVNNTSMPHHMYTYLYLHNIYITIHSLLHTSSILLGGLAGSGSPRLIHLPIFFSETIMNNLVSFKSSCRKRHVVECTMLISLFSVCHTVPHPSLLTTAICYAGI
jgi:hypothetical protein